MTATTLAMTNPAPPKSLAEAPASIEALALRLKLQRDGATLEALIQRTEKACFHLALSVLQDADLAKDALQESYLSVFRQIEQLREPDAFRAWLFRIVNRTCHDILRKRKNEVELDPTDPMNLSYKALGSHSEPDPSQAVSKRELLKATFRNLPDIDREAIALREICNLSYEEMARTLAIPIGTVRSRLAKARQRFINAYRKEQADD